MEPTSSSIICTLHSKNMQPTSSDLHVAIYACNIDVVQQCVKNKNIINSYWRGCTPVSSAIYLKRYTILQILVENGADVNLISRNNKMEPPLFAACRLRSYTAIDIILRSSCLDIDQRDFFGRSALWSAARYCEADIVERLLNRGANLNSAQSTKHPISGALQQSKKSARDIVQLLLRKGSLLDDVCEESSFKWSLKHADRETFCLLVSAGCKIKCQNEDWLSYDKLPSKWKEDQQFCSWLNSIKQSPPSLLILSATFIRTFFIKRSNSLSSHHVKQLQLPDLLCKLLLFQD